MRKYKIQHSSKKSPRKVDPSWFVLAGLVLLLATYGPLIKDEIWYKIRNMRSQIYILDGNSAGKEPGQDPQQEEESVFAKYLSPDSNPFGYLLSSQPIYIKPVNSNFALVIEKIGVNAPVVADVNVSDSKAYMSSLKEGIAHASVSPYPSEEPGNVYLFAHASVNFWQLGKYANVFNLLRKLEPGDEVHLFYRGSDYVYTVMDKEVYKGWNTFPLTRSVIEPILTLQTCDPPGTTFNRMVVTAKLKEVRQ